MRCPRCGHRVRGASWFCPNCGAATDNLASEAVASRRRRQLAAGMGLAALVVLAISAWLAQRNAEDRAGRRADAGTATAQALALAASATDTPRLPSPTPVPSSTPDRLAPPSAPSPTAASGAAPSAAGVRLRDGRPVWSAPRLVDPPEIDGWLDDWTGPPLELAAIVIGRNAWDGAADLSARALAGWDDEALYLGVRVYDDVFVPSPEREMLFDGDSLELQIDADLLGDWERRTYDIDDWHVGLSPGDFAGEGPRVHLWRPQLETAPRLELASRRLADGYILEARLPWEELEVDPRRVRALGFALGVNDADGEEPGRQTLISTSPARDPRDPTTIGAIVLEGAGAP